jgi:hypothetical protein
MTSRTLRLRGRTIALAAFITTVLVAPTAAPANAALGIACPTPASHPFTPWSDGAAYAFAPNGGFEDGASGWTLTGGARVVAGNEPFAVHNAGDRSSLSLPAGSSATSGRMCIGALSTKMRFFARSAGSSTSRLTVRVLYDGGLGQVLGIADAGTITAGKWQPTPAITMLGGLLPLLTRDVRIRFISADSRGSWSVDDVYVDPLMHR